MDTEGYDLSRYAAVTEEDDDLEVADDAEAMPGEAPVRRRTRRGGRR